MAVLEVKELTKKYGEGESEVIALDHVSFSVERGEFVAIIGASGSGKSTLMNIVGCLDVPDEGDYRLDDLDVTLCTDNELSVVRNKKIGFIFQQFNLLGKLSAIDNVALPLIYQGISPREARKRATASLDKVGLSDRENIAPTSCQAGSSKESQSHGHS